MLRSVSAFSKLAISLAPCIFYGFCAIKTNQPTIPKQHFSCYSLLFPIVVLCHLRVQVPYNTAIGFKIKGGRLLRSEAHLLWQESDFSLRWQHYLSPPLQFLTDFEEKGFFFLKQHLWLIAKSCRRDFRDHRFYEHVHCMPLVGL